jgi:acyl carrier protein
MQPPPPEALARNLHDELIVLLKAGNSDWVGDLTDDMSLITSGHLDSSGIYNLAIFIESQVGHEIDMSEFDLAKEWDTVNHILAFIDNQRQSA